MNITHFEHAVYALLIQLFIAWLTKNYWIGAAAAIGFFVGREHAQREYKLGDPSHLQPWEGFDIWRWSTDAQLDLLVPCAAVLALAWAIHLWRRRR
ncbi:MAG TPA: hypothetical protein VKZ70_13715 [Burkholderiaceae bacterium]|nr:hypothetical protein [Burkholderiaceae bacterium]